MPVNLTKPPWVTRMRAQIQWAFRYIADNYQNPNLAWKQNPKK